MEFCVTREMGTLSYQGTLLISKVLPLHQWVNRRLYLFSASFSRVSASIGVVAQTCEEAIEEAVSQCSHKYQTIRDTKEQIGQLLHNKYCRNTDVCMDK